jgi:hypothetical protein
MEEPNIWNNYGNRNPLQRKSGVTFSDAEITYFLIALALVLWLIS